MKPTMTITIYIHHLLNISMHERWDLVFVWEVDFNRDLLRSIRRNDVFSCHCSTCACWIRLWSLCLWIPGVNMLPVWRKSLCWPNNLFIFFGGLFCVGLFWWWTHRGRLWKNFSISLIREIMWRRTEALG